MFENKLINEWNNKREINMISFIKYLFNLSIFNFHLFWSKGRSNKKINVIISLTDDVSLKTRIIQKIKFWEITIKTSDCILYFSLYINILQC